MGASDLDILWDYTPLSHPKTLIDPSGCFGFGYLEGIHSFVPSKTSIAKFVFCFSTLSMCRSRILSQHSPSSLGYLVGRWASCWAEKSAERMAHSRQLLSLF